MQYTDRQTQWYNPYLYSVVSSSAVIIIICLSLSQLRRLAYSGLSHTYAFVLGVSFSSSQALPPHETTIKKYNSSQWLSNFKEISLPNIFPCTLSTTNPMNIFNFKVGSLLVEKKSSHHFCFYLFPTILSLSPPFCFFLLLGFSLVSDGLENYLI